MACNIKEVMVEIQSLINEQAVEVMSKTIIDKKDLVEISNLKKQVDILQKKKQTYEKYERERKSVKGKEDARRKVDKIAEEIKEVEELIDVLSTDSPKAKEKIVKSLLRKIGTVDSFMNRWDRLSREGRKKKIVEKPMEFINEKRNKSSKKYSAGEIIEQELSIDEIVEIEKRNEEYLENNPDVIVVNGNRFMWENGVITVDATASRADRAVYLAHEIAHDKTVNWLERNSNDRDVVKFSRLMKMVKNKLENMSITELGKPDNMLLRERLLYTGIGTNQELGENVAVMLAEPEVQRALERMLGNDNRNLIQRVLDRVKEFLWPTKEEKVYADKVMKAVKNIERKAVEEKASVKDKAGIIRDIGNAKAANEIFNEIGKCI